MAGALATSVPRTDAYERCMATKKIATMAMDSHMLADTSMLQKDVDEAVSRETMNQMMKMDSHVPGHTDAASPTSTRSTLSKLLW